LIDQAVIINFQSHEETVFDFCSGVNIIKGNNHAGKSASIRAISWPFINRPSGDGFVSDFAKKKSETSTTIGFSENTWIKRKRQSGVNSYETSESDEPYLAIRSDVPTEVSDITKIRPENIQSQRERYFFLEDTSGGIAKKWNRIVGLEVIDEKRTRIKSIISEARIEIESLNSKISSGEEELKKYNSVDTLSDTCSEIDDLLEERKRVKENLETVKYLNDSIESDLSILESLKDISTLSILSEEMKGLLRERDTLSDSMNKLLDIDEEIHSDLEIIEKFGDIERAKSIILDLRELFKNRSIIALKKDLVSSLYIDIEEDETFVVRACTELESLKNKRLEIEKKLGYCKYCGAEEKHWRQEYVK